MAYVERDSTLYLATGAMKVSVVDNSGNALSVINGNHGNAWAAAAVAAAGVSAVATMGAGLRVVSAFGNASAATTIMLQYSADGINWYDSGVSKLLAGAGDFAIDVTTAATRLRLRSSAAATITASILGK